MTVSCPVVFERHNYPGIEQTTQILYTKGLLGVQTTAAATVDGWFADSSLFKIFTFTFIEGDPNTALNQPESIVLTEKTAFRFFGDKKALGKSLFFEHMIKPLQVTGVIREIPENSPSTSNFYISMSTFTKILNPKADKHSQMPGAITYVLLKQSTDKRHVEKSILTLLLANENYKLKGTAMDYKATLKPLINSPLSPFKRKCHTFGLVILLFVVLLSLVKSVVNLTKSTYAKLGISEKKSHLTPGFLAFTLTGWVLLKSLLAFLLALLTVAGIVLLSKPVFNFKIEAVFCAFCAATFISLISVVIISIISSIWVALVPVFNPVETYFSKKKGYGQR